MGTEIYVIKGVNCVRTEKKDGTPDNLYPKGSPQYHLITSMHKTHRSVGP